ncbi:MAG: pyridoxine 5'-phosphate synthase, partial [Bradymonadaceae bacterium]
LRGAMTPNMQRAEATADKIVRELEKHGLMNEPVGVDIVELHTGDYCEAAPHFTNKLRPSPFDADTELTKLIEASKLAHDLGLIVAAGHGLDYKNVHAVAAIAEIEEFNIGHSIVARAVLVGFERAVTEMIEALEIGRGSVL